MAVRGRQARDRCRRAPARPRRHRRRRGRLVAREPPPAGAPTREARAHGPATTRPRRPRTRVPPPAPAAPARDHDRAPTCRPTTSQRLLAARAAGDGGDFTLLDVREPDEHDVRAHRGRRAGARASARARRSGPSSTRRVPVVAYCARGPRPGRRRSCWRRDGFDVRCCTAACSAGRSPGTRRGPPPAEHPKRDEAVPGSVPPRPFSGANRAFAGRVSRRRRAA